MKRFLISILLSTLVLSFATINSHFAFGQGDTMIPSNLFALSTLAGVWSPEMSGPGLADVAGWDDVDNYSTIQYADIDGDGQDELLARSDNGIVYYDFHAEISGLTASNDGPTALGQPTQFMATVTNGTNVSYDWDFGDGNSENGAVVEHTYATTGTYTVELTASNLANGETVTTMVTVNVYSYLPLVLIY